MMLGIISVNAQGSIGASKDEMMQFYSESDDYKVEVWKPSKENEFENEVISAVSEKYGDQKIHYLNEDGAVYMTLIYNLTKESFIWFTNAYDKEYVKVKGNEWNNYYQNGFIQIRMLTEESSNIPFFIIKYIPY